MANNPRHKSDKNNFNVRVLRVFTLSFLLLTCYFLISDYFTTIHHAEHLTLQRLDGVVKSIANNIDADVHQKLTKEFVQKDQITDSKSSDSYFEIHDLLKDEQESHGVGSPIYTFVKSEAIDHALEFIGTSSEEPYFRHHYTSFPKEAFYKLEQGGQLGLYSDEFGSWLSAFAPIKNSNGNIVAYVQADEKFDSFIASVRSQLIRKATFSILGFACAIFFLLPYLKQLLAKEEEHKTLLKSSLDATKELSAQLEVKEQALKEYANKLEQSNRDLTDFAHIASHDLKAPIRNINSFSQLILRKNKEKFDKSTLENFDFIIKNSDRAQKLINGLLSYSTADKNIGEPVEFCMEDAAKIAQQSLASIINEKQVHIEVQDMPCIAANTTLVSQVLQNLINNGIKYNQAKCPIIVVGTGVDNKRGRYFFVEDNGIGIPAKYQKDIFKMFTRLHNQTEYDGSGIGLAFCNRVVKTYGGEMWLDSTENEGSRFYFTLPKATILEPVLA